MQIITVAVIKGGTGKTATCASLAQCAAAEGRRVLCIDLDPQAALTNCLGADRSAAGAYELLTGAPIQNTIQGTEMQENIEVIAGSVELATYPGKEYRLADALKPIQKQYDLIIIDTPPYFGPLTFEALNTATGLIVAMNTDAGSIQGQRYILDIAKEARAKNRKLKVLGSIITQFDKRPVITRHMREIIEEQGQGLKCPLLGTVSRSIAIQEAALLHMSLYDYAPKSKPAQEYKDIYNKIIG